MPEVSGSLSGTACSGVVLWFVYLSSLYASCETLSCVINKTRTCSGVASSVHKLLPTVTQVHGYYPYSSVGSISSGIAVMQVLFLCLCLYQGGISQCPQLSALVSMCKDLGSSLHTKTKVGTLHES